MKRNLLLLSSTLLLLNVPALAADSAAPALTPNESGDGIWTAPKPSSKPAAHAPAAAQVPAATVTPVAPATSTKHTGLVPPPPPVTMAPPPKPATKTAPEVVKTAESNLVTVGTGGPYQAKTNKVQRFVDYLELKQGMENSPLTLNINNVGFQWFRLLISNQVVATEKSLGGKSSGHFDLTGIVSPGTNQIVVEAGGRPGNAIGWNVTTVATAKLDRVDPEEAIVGDTIKIKGKNFSTTPSSDVVTFNGKSGQVVSAKATELQVKIPQDAQPGENTLVAKVNGASTNSLKIKVRGIPELSGSNLQGVPPGQQLVIFGKNFSKQLGENKVLFGETSAEVIAGNENQLTVVVPNLPWTAGHTPSPISVQVGKAKSKNTILVQVGPQMFSDPSLNTGNRDVPLFVPGNGNNF